MGRDIMGDFIIKKGFDIGLEGRPALDIADLPESSRVVVYPLEHRDIKQRLLIQEGAQVSCGTALVESKLDDRFKVCAPAAGVVESIIRGERRFIEKIVIKKTGGGKDELFQKYTVSQAETLSRDAVLAQLLRTGYLAFIRQRPFGRMADAAAEPKSIFINAMNTAPFLADAGIVVNDDADAFQAGINLMTRLTVGNVYLCVNDMAVGALKSVKNVEVHTFRGPHPAGNTSVHISKIAPMSPHDIVWTVNAVDLVLIGRLFLDGKLPSKRIIAVGGPGVKELARKHYRMDMGGAFSVIGEDWLVEGEQRFINGDALAGTAVESDGCLRLNQSALTVVPEGRERNFLGWMEPGFNQYSFTRLCASTFFGRTRKWKLGTNRNGSERAIVLTGHYDRVMPMDIMVDFLLKAVMSGDSEEAIKLGILETLPEDYALCEFICPSKLEIQSIIAGGLKQIEEEGI